MYQDIKLRGTLFHSVQALKTKFASSFFSPNVSLALRAVALSIMGSMSSITGEVMFLELNFTSNVNTAPPHPNVSYR